jgi:hypothetical protein
VTLALLGLGSNVDAFGTVVLDPDVNEGVLAVRGLGILHPSLCYQLWLVKGGLRASAGQFSVDAHGYGSLVLEVPAELRGFDAFLVTIEPRGGSASPGSRLVMEGRR